MRRPFPTARSIFAHSSQTAALLGVAVLAMAAAPAASRTDGQDSGGGAPVAPPVRAVAEPAGPVVRTLTFEAPVRGHAINSRFGPRRLGGAGPSRPHQGVDIAAPMGTTVFSSAEGVVLRTGYQAGGYGNFVELSHPNGMTTFYAHLSRIDVASGDRVSGGERIGLVGSTGYSTGPHLHFEARRDGNALNPERVLGQSFQVRMAPLPAPGA